jgi:hypothetical protein
MNVLTEYKAALDRFNAHFKYEGFAYGIEDETEAFWKLDGNEVGWAEEAWDEDDEDAEYSEEAREIYRADDLTMILIHDCTGAEYFKIFDNSKELK